MTPKEKAWEMFRKFKNIPDKWKNEKVFQNYYAKECAITAVDEIIKEIDNFNRHGGFQYRIDYFNEVKQEIEKL